MDIPTYFDIKPNYRDGYVYGYGLTVYSGATGRHTNHDSLKEIEEYLFNTYRIWPIDELGQFLLFPVIDTFSTESV